MTRLTLPGGSRRTPVRRIYYKNPFLFDSEIDEEVTEKKYNEKKLECDQYNKLADLEDLEEELGIDLATFLKGVDPDTCFMEITKDKKFYFCGDAYYGTYTKEELLELIKNLLFMYWALTRKEL